MGAPGVPACVPTRSALSRTALALGAVFVALTLLAAAALFGVGVRTPVGALLAGLALGLSVGVGIAILRFAKRVDERAELLMDAGIAHEVNNPLAIMRTNAELHRLDVTRALAREDATPLAREIGEKSLDHVRANLEGIARISRLVSSLHLLTRGERVATERVPLARVVQATVALAGPRLRDRAPRVDVDVPPDLHALGSSDALGQILLNLVLNAADAVPPGAGVIRIAGERIADGRARILVEDNGPGVSPDMRARLFQPFQTTKPTGTGLGLRISERLARECGGALTYEDRPGGGARFVLELREA
jgi:two-component system C4-dicarboxylate transport sensor histidine kinase DctB